MPGQHTVRQTCTVFPVPISSAISALPLCLSANSTPALWKLHVRHSPHDTSQ